MLDFKRHQTAVQAILILSESPGLSAKQVFEQLEKKGYHSTLQNVHKMLQRLEKSGVLKQDHFHYFASKEWIAELKVLAGAL